MTAHREGRSESYFCSIWFSRIIDIIASVLAATLAYQQEKCIEIEIINHFEVVGLLGKGMVR